LLNDIVARVGNYSAERVSISTNFTNIYTSLTSINLTGTNSWTLAQALNVSNTTNAVRLANLETSNTSQQTSITSINLTAINSWILAQALNVSNTTNAVRLANLETSNTTMYTTKFNVSGGWITGNVNLTGKNLTGIDVLSDNGGSTGITVKDNLTISATYCINFASGGRICNG
jgi:hypothetical protein